MATVYKHIRLDTLEVFYIGIGKEIKRAYSKQRRNKYWNSIVSKHGYKVEIFKDNGVLMFTGVILGHAFESDSGWNLLTISGYSKSGILEDVTIPPSLYPLESNGKNLKEIAKRLCDAYGIGIVFDKSIDVELSRAFKKTTADSSESVKSYISKLTSQRNILLSHNEKGEVVMFKPNTNAKPKYYFNKDNTLKMSSSWNGQGMHSVINVVRQPSKKIQEFQQ